MFRSIKSKLEDKEKLKQACSTAISGLQTTLRVVKEVTGDVGLPGLQAGIGGLLFVLDAIKKTSQNVEDIEKLSKQIDGLNQVLEISKNGATFSTAVVDRIDRVFATSNTAIEDLRRMASGNTIKRFVNHGDDGQLICSHIQSITWAIQSFTVETMLSIEFSLDEHTIKIQEKIDNLCVNTASGFQQVNARLDIKDRHPPYAMFSPFNCKDRERCLEGTRTGILDQIFRWIGVSDPRSESGPVSNEDIDNVAGNSCIFWISGSAGTGKTTIACTVAEACRTLGTLGASFFCSRDDADCSNPNLIFTSIAYQLGNFNPLFRAEVTRVMKSSPDIGYTTPLYQLEELIVKPLRTLGSSFSPCIVVLDALDECRETGMTSAILSSLSLHVDELLPLKFLVTSRPESRITTVFKSSDLDPVTRRYILHEVELGVVQNDIERYLSSKLSSVRELYHLEDEWPSRADIHSLTRLSFGLFIFASTSIKYIEDPDYCDPKHQLARLLSNAPTAIESSSPYYNLDQLYTQMLNHAFPNISSHLSGRLKTILGTIVLLRDPLSSLALERLLGVQSHTVHVTLQRLHSVVMVPDDDSQVIRTLHPSFFDFIISPTRCLNSKYLVNPQTQHTLLARACLDTMKGLKRDICGIRNPSMLNNEIDDLATRIMTCIPPQLQYACRHWAWHLENAMFSDILIDLVKEFCSKYLLYWVEAISLLGDLRSGLLALGTAQRMIANTGGVMTDAMVLLHDCERFTLEFFSIISTCSLQIYHSALLFAPQDISIKKTYGTELDLPLKIHNGLSETWSLCIRTIEGHSGSVSSASFSPDGRCIVSASSDNTVRLWDSVSGVHLDTFGGHSDEVSSVAFSPDGKYIVSGSYDNTLRLWDAVSGENLHTLKGHSSPVHSVAFSPDTTRIASGSGHGTVRLWDALSGAHLNALTGHFSLVYSVTFSPDGMRIVSGSYDNTLRLWDAATGAYLKTFKGHSSSVTSVAFSPDGTRIVSASGDKTLRLWDAVSGSHLITFKGHSSLVYSVAFSPNGAYIVSGSSDKTVRLWNAASGAHLNTFEGHFNEVNLVAFSPDGTRIVSGSSDKTLRLWAAASDTQLSTVVRHSNPVLSVAFSLDCTRIVSGSADKTLRLWNAVNGVYLNTLKGHSSSVTSVAFSPDGTRIVSGSGDKTLRLWDAVSGACLDVLKGHSSLIYSVAFSPEGTRIVSGSYDNTLRLWDSVNGEHLMTLKGHFDSVYSAVFSPDGKHIISGSRDKTLWQWDAISGMHLNTLTGHHSSVHSVAFSPDGTRIVSGSADNTLRVWDTINGEYLMSFKGHCSAVESVAISCSVSHNFSIETGPMFGYIAEDGWVHSITRNRRVCWIPVSCRPNTLATRGDRVVLGTDDGRVLLIDFAQMDSYFDDL